MKQLEIVCSKVIPFKGYSAMNWFGKFYQRMERCGRPISDTTMNHEGIHVCQAEDFCKNRIIGHLIFYLLYVLEWGIKSIICLFNGGKAYRSISFEQEAYANDKDFNYQDKRKHFAWKKYIFKIVK